MDILKAQKSELLQLKQQLTEQFEAYVKKGLSLDMSRGKPSAMQLDISEGMLTVLSENAQLKADGTDARNYGLVKGMPSCRALFSELLCIPEDNIIAAGNSSLTLMHDTLVRFALKGDAHTKQPWVKQDTVKWLCPVPGYDRHFAICEMLGIEMIPVPMKQDGPDMDEVERLAGSDPTIKGIWCVPKYSNPEGKVYSDEVVGRLASMSTAAPDFKIMWDNAYCVHGLTDKDEPLANIFELCQKAGTENRVFIFASTSKITYPGAGVAVVAASTDNIAWLEKLIGIQTVGPNKVNQLRHVAFFKNADGVHEHMKKHGEILKPKFDMIIDMFAQKLEGTGAGTWHSPSGGYFISYDAMPGCASRIHALCKQAGVVMTNAGATYPYGKDPQDSNIRIAPSLPPLDELKQAMEVFCTCALLAATEKQLETL